MAHRSPPPLPTDLRTRLEAARLDLLALFRALDQMDLSPAEIPQRLIQQLFELDADYAEALWALDQPHHSLDFHAMLRDTLASLEQLPAACAQFRKYLPRRAHPRDSSPWKRPSEEIWPSGRRTTWYPEETPKTVKHP